MIDKNLSVQDIVIKNALSTGLGQHGHRFGLNAADIRDLGEILFSVILQEPLRRADKDEYPTLEQVSAARAAFWSHPRGGAEAITAALLAARKEEK